MGATPLTPEQRVEQTTQTLQSLLELATTPDSHHDIVQLREALARLGTITALQECHCAQFIALFESLNALLAKHKQQLSCDDQKRWAQFALLGKNIAPTLARQLIAVEDWGRNLPALAHLMILALFGADEHPGVQRDLLVAHIERGYQTFHLCCDLHWKDDTRYNRLLDECEAVIGEHPKLLRWSNTKP
jgi:hypothetical protein